MKQRNIAFLLAMLLSIVAIQAFAYNAKVNGIYYYLNNYNKTASVAYESYDGNSYSGNIVIPETILNDGITYRVTSISWSAFMNCADLSSITIPSSVDNISGNPFQNCPSLSSIIVSSENKKYNSSNNCNAIIETATNTLITGCKNTIIPSNVTTIGSYAFSGCTGLTSITIPNSVTTIGSYAFSGCTGLSSITIPNSVTKVESNAFKNTPWYDNLPDGVVYLGKVAYLYKGTMPSNTTIEIKDGTVTIGASAFSECTGLTNVLLPNSITAIGSSAFAGCSRLTKVNIPDGVTTIGGGAFSGCTSLTIVDIPGSVKTIDGNAFFCCYSLKSLTLSEGITTIGHQAFDFCYNLTAVTIPKSVENFRGIAFGGCTGLQSIVVEDGNPVYDSRENCNAIIETSSNTLIAGCKSTIIPESVTSLGEYAFWCCRSLQSIIIPPKIKSLRGKSFNDCTLLKSITVDGDNPYFDSRNNCNAIINSKTDELLVGSNSTIFPKDIKKIGSSAFDGRSSLPPVLIIPEGVDSLGWCAFDNCRSLKKITIPSSVNYIEAYAFQGCSGLTDMYCYASGVPDTQSDVFRSSNIANATLHVPAASVAAYQSTAPWSGFKEVVAIEDEVTSHELSFTILADTLESYAVQDAVDGVNPIAAYNAEMEGAQNSDRFFNRPAYDANSPEAQSYRVAYTWRDNNPAIRGAGDNNINALIPGSSSLKVEDFFDFWYSASADATAEANDWVKFNEKDKDGFLVPNVNTQSMRAAIRSGVANRLIDGATYKVTMTMQRQDGENVWTMVNSYDIDITKVMPPAMPAEFGFRPLQFDNGVWPFYLRPYAGVEYGETATDSPWKISWDDSDRQAPAEHNCRWGVDVRPFDFKELFTGMILPEEYNIDKNYYFVFKESGDFAAADVDATEASDEQYKDADAIAVYTEDVDGGCYQLPKIHWSHVGESKNVEAGYIYRGISAKLDVTGEEFLAPQNGQTNSKVLNVKNQDYVIAPVPVMAGSKQVVASFSCAFDAAVVMAADATENAFAYNADVFVNATDATFKLKNIAWYASGNYQAYFNTQFPASWTDAEGGVGTLADVIADSYFWVDMTSLKCNVASPDGFNYQDFYYNPYFAKSDGTKANTFNEIVNIVMSRRAAPERIWDFNSDVEGTFTFNIYDIWFHRRTVTVSFKIKKPVSSDGETDELQRYLNSLTDTEDELTANVYKRTFRNGDWQALYVPFEMDYSDWSDKFEVARVSGFRSSSAGLEGGVLEATMVESGKVEANYPYLIRAKSKYGATLTVNVTGGVNMTSGTTAFASAAIIGNYEKLYKMNTFKRYRLQGGALSIPNSDNEMLPPFRWYARGPENQASRLTIEVNGVATDITSSPATTDDRSLRVYNLSGNRIGVMRSEELNLLPKGVYIINGRKYTVK